MHHIDSECCLPTGEHNHAITVQEKQNKTARIAEALTCHSQCSHHSLSKCCIYLCYLLLNFLSKSNITTLTIVCGYFKKFMIFVLLCNILFFIKWQGYVSIFLLEIWVTSNYASIRKKMFLKKPNNRGFFVLFYLFVIIIVVYDPQSICSYKQDQISDKELTLFWLMALEVRQFKCKTVSSTWHYVSVLLLHLIVVECIMWQFRWKLKRFCIANSINRNKADSITISDFKMHCWAILIKTS